MDNILISAPLSFALNLFCNILTRESFRGRTPILRSQFILQYPHPRKLSGPHPYPSLSIYFAISSPAKAPIDIGVVGLTRISRSRFLLLCERR
jgi:hypothetical protein